MSTEFDRLIGASPELQNVINAARVVAVTDVTVLIQGESGTGKELLAQALHAASRRAKRTLITINCAALPEALVESELFGHRKGAFTGATQDYLGRIRAAQGGTVFLDEVGELSLPVQAKLLRFLETGECQPVGATGVVATDVRVIAATNSDLAARVQSGHFRGDLYYRLHVVPMELPPLRQRRGDIVPLLAHCLRYFSSHHQVPAPEFSRDALRILKAYAWPGNVRELRNLCERLVILLPGQHVDVQNLPQNLVQAARDTGRILPLAARAPFAAIADVEKAMLRDALYHFAGNQSQAARSLGLSRDAFLYRLKKYGIHYQVSLTH